MQNKRNDYLFVFDIETIPDTDSVANLTGCNDTESIEYKRDLLSNYHLEITNGQNSFPRQLFHRIVAISALIAQITTSNQSTSYKLLELKSAAKEDSTEAELITSFFSTLEKLEPKLITFNGRTFDIPVLKYRAMVHGISCAKFYNLGNKWENYSQRYSSEYHCDLLDILSDYGSSARIKLSEVCSILGFPGKMGVDGSKVTDLFDQGKVNEIRDYCETDVLNTYLVYLRVCVHRGTISKDDYNNAIDQILSFIDANNKAHLTEFKQEFNIASRGNIYL